MTVLKGVYLDTAGRPRHLLAFPSSWGGGGFELGARRMIHTNRGK